MRGSPCALTWFGHATVLLEIDGVKLLTDPVLGRRIGPLVRTSAPPPVAELPTVDAVLLSHLHADHADLPSLRSVARDRPLVAPHGAGSWLEQRGLRDVRELRAGEETEFGPVRVAATPATHDPRRRPFGPAADPVGFLVRGSRSVYFAGDTDLFDEMAGLRGSVDVALLPVWGWGSTLGPGHLNPERAAIAAARIAPAIAIPIHWGTFSLPRPGRRLSDPTWPAHEFARSAKERAPGVDVRVLAPGDRTLF